MLLVSALSAVLFAELSLSGGASAAEPAAPGSTVADPSDVVATGTVGAPMPLVFDALVNLEVHRGLWSEACVKKWEPGSSTEGVGASASLIYVPSAMHRKLTATISKVDPPKRVTLDHAGKRGFLTTWTLRPAGEQATEVEVHTWIQPPPWPVRRLYSNRIQPAWEQCQREAIQALAARPWPKPTE